MATPSPASWAAAAILTAAQLNTQLRDALKFLLNPPQVKAYPSTSQNVTTGTTVAIALDLEAYDRAAGAASTMHDTAVNNSRIVPNAEGRYLVTAAGVSWQAQATAVGARVLEIWKNGGMLVRHQLPMDAAYNAQTVYMPALVHVVDCNGTTDYIEIAAGNSSGITLAVSASEVTVTRIG